MNGIVIKTECVICESVCCLRIGLTPARMAKQI